MKEVYFKQLLSYLRLTHLHCGILVNFNTDDIIDSTKNVLNEYILISHTDFKDFKIFH